MSEIMQNTKPRRRAPLVLIGIAVFVIGAFVILGQPTEDNTAGDKNTAEYMASDLDPYKVGEMQTFVTVNEGVDLSFFAFKDADGGDKTLADFNGKVVLVNFWATWCAPCRKEMPSLSRLQTAMGGDDFEVVTISLDRKGVAQIRPFFDQLKLTNLPMYVDQDSNSLRDLGMRGLPVTILMDRQGREIGRVTGPAEWDYDESQALITSQL